MIEGRKLRDICVSQLRVGSLGFGGPLATMAYMRDELVDKKRLVSADSYFKGLAAVKVMPGPVSSLLATFLGLEIAGPLGGLVSVASFIFPSFLMLMLICLFEDRLAPGFFQSPSYLRGMLGLQIVVIGVIAVTCARLFLDAYRRRYLGETRTKTVACMALLAATLSFLKVPELAILTVCAFTAWFFYGRSRLPGSSKLQVHPFSIFFTFFWSGLSVFGTGYMVLPYLQRILVTEKGWLSAHAFLNAVSYGNLTPGPVLVASTYMGYHMQGWVGALSATVGIFLGPILLMLALYPILKKGMNYSWVDSVLLGILPAVAATILVSLQTLASYITWSFFNVAVLVAATYLCWRRWPIWALFIFGAAAQLLKA